MSNVKMVRLSSGEEIICKYSFSDGKHNLADSAILFPAGQGKLAFAKWLPYMNEEKHKKGIEIDDKFVLFVVDIDSELSKQYESMITGIAIPQQSGLITPTGSSLKLST